MARKGDAVFFRYLVEEEGEVTEQVSEGTRDGYFEYWTQSSIVVERETMVGIIPIALTIPIGIVRDGQTGKVYLCKPQYIKFK